MNRRFIFAIACTTLFLAACDSESSRRAEETKRRLIGTWFAEYTDSQGRRTQETVTLEADSTFKERIKVFPADGAIANEDVLSGEWFYDGVNFKRIYKNSNGKLLPNSQFMYQTYDVKSLSDSEFVGTNNIEKSMVTYRKPSGG